MHHKVILGLVLMLVLIISGLFFFNSNNATTDKQQEDVKTIIAEDINVENAIIHTIKYTSDGFSPKVVEIQKGDIVKFTNDSGSGMRVASAIHPIHSQYPQKSDNDCLGSSFDSCDVTQSGESWSFTFNEIGEWGYHNHVRATKRGTVIVN
ncbi:hypothetical protein CL630_00825 [bacterium]|nr:hypothetical protein [bacterium]|tara:strand:- start:34175 stop:34627 length:453 start_codon:yes stop_codon:yes gene_type:complete